MTTTLSLVSRQLPEPRLRSRVPLCLPVCRQVYRFHLHCLVAETKIKAHTVALWLNKDPSCNTSSESTPKVQLRCLRQWWPVSAFPWSRRAWPSPDESSTACQRT